jgi:hypothetical protein
MKWRIHDIAHAADILMHYVIQAFALSLKITVEKRGVEPIVGQHYGMTIHVTEGGSCFRWVRIE